MESSYAFGPRQVEAAEPIDAVLETVARRLDAAIWTYDHHFDVLLADVWR